MLKAIVTVMDENDRIIQANRLIFENEPFGTPVSFGIEHEFYFKVVTADEEFIRKLTEDCTAGFTLRADEIREAWENTQSRKTCGECKYLSLGEDRCINSMSPRSGTNKTTPACGCFEQSKTWMED